MADSKDDPSPGPPDESRPARRETGAQKGARGRRPDAPEHELDPAEDDRLPQPVPIGGGDPPVQPPVVVQTLPGAPLKVSVHMDRAGYDDLDALPLWAAILVHTRQHSYPRFAAFVDRALCDGGLPATAGLVEGALPIDSYHLLMSAAEAFLLTQAGVWTTSGKPGNLRSTIQVVPRTESGGPLPPSTLVTRDTLRLVDVNWTFGELDARLQTFLGREWNNYLEAVLEANFDGGNVAVSPFCPAYLNPTGPYLIELIWSYWMEQGMMVQTFLAILLRFQNVALPGSDRLAQMALDPLRPLNNFIWGWIQADARHLTSARRSYEYNHQYGFSVRGSEVQPLKPVDPRTNFLTAFHRLLRQCALFFIEDNDTTVIADAFPVLNALKELHLILSQGADSQFRDLPWRARQEMLVQQWMLARPELKEFLNAKPMVAYPEPWMGRVDAMRQIQGWGDTSITYYWELATFAERILLSVRYGNWSYLADHEYARSWARFWRPEIKGYIYDYQIVTGVDLGGDYQPGTESAWFTEPWVLIRNRMQAKALLAAAAE
jgi:hypothetical protein